MPDTDDEFRSLLARRVLTYREEEARVSARLRELEVERDSIVSRLAAAEELYTAEFGEPLGRDAATDHETATPSPGVLGPYTGLTWRDAMRRVITEAGEPLHVKEIWARLERGGFRTESRDPIRSAVAILVQTPSDFEGFGHNRYGVRRSAQLTVVEGGDA